MSVTEQRYKAVLAVIADGRTLGESVVSGTCADKPMHRWLARYEGEGLEVPRWSLALESEPGRPAL